ncbi:hypothetical protein BCV70DRAFT_42612 [Testicularia cyperi]|uniref:Uncharacterized protein n=1 Tax=Testicularia cyperi TaxID=1882483 RepID=A0A317XHY2_9BASI|nr:hypothetical protein BCV70DRAFT_42612 [Testicularia cyperi]
MLATVCCNQPFLVCGCRIPRARSVPARQGAASGIMGCEIAKPCAYTLVKVLYCKYNSARPVEHIASSHRRRRRSSCSTSSHNCCACRPYPHFERSISITSSLGDSLLEVETKFVLDRIVAASLFAACRTGVRRTTPSRLINHLHVGDHDISSVRITFGIRSESRAQVTDSYQHA